MQSTLHAPCFAAGTSMADDYRLAEYALTETPGQKHNVWEHIRLVVFREVISNTSKYVRYAWLIEILWLLFVNIVSLHELILDCDIGYSLTPTCGHCYSSVFITYLFLSSFVWFLNLYTYILLKSRRFTFKLFTPLKGIFFSRNSKIDKREQISRIREEASEKKFQQLAILEEQAQKQQQQEEEVNINIFNIDDDNNGENRDSTSAASSSSSSGGDSSTAPSGLISGGIIKKNKINGVNTNINAASASQAALAEQLRVLELEVAMHEQLSILGMEDGPPENTILFFVMLSVMHYILNGLGIIMLIRSNHACLPASRSFMSAGADVGRNDLLFSTIFVGVFIMAPLFLFGRR